MDFTAAIAELTRAAETCEHNAPIHEAEGSAEQAALSRGNAANYRAAMQALAAASLQLEALRALLAVFPSGSFSGATARALLLAEDAAAKASAVR
jgi:hypothetical protein